jgi:type I restriction enzyme, R subunit
MNKKDLSERDICSKFIGPAIKRAGWDGMMQIREEVAFTKGRIIVRGKLVTRGKAKRADYILYYKPNIPIAIVEAKDNNHSIGDGMQQALDYAVTLNIPFVFSSNGDGFIFHDRTGTSMEKEATLSLDAFPSPKELAALLDVLPENHRRPGPAAGAHAGGLPFADPREPSVARLGR